MKSSGAERRPVAGPPAAQPSSTNVQSRCGYPIAASRRRMREDTTRRDSRREEDGKALAAELGKTAA
jgi:hypothetical protein